MRFIAWLDISWVDEFLILSDDVESLLILKEDIWYPDISVYDAVDDPQTISDGKHVILFQNGHVSWYQGGEYIIRCVIDIRRYPFDAQTCNLRVGAWHTTAWTQRLIDSGKGLDISGYTENGEWEITNTMVESNNSPGFNTSWIRYHIYLKRRPLHPVLNTLIPIVMLSFLNTLVFLLPANSGEKMTLCISVLLAFTVFLTVFNDTMPKMSTTISYLSIYLVVQLGMSVVGIVMSICIWRTKDRENYSTFDFLEHTAHRKDQEGITGTMNANSESVKGHRLSFRLPKNMDGIESIPKCECPEMDGFRGDETDYHMSYSNYSNEFARQMSSKNIRCRREVFSSSKRYSIGEKQKDEKRRQNIEQLDLILFKITFALVLGSTIILLITLLV
ncbi:neuronal acetylcholine receptor subunit beta-2-like [Mizuhopecten yessoensis]|nr:neuronal acetylcholine receptor subunit beta-2-like [Mizuhopecten yessoensis]